MSKVFKEIVSESAKLASVDETSITLSRGSTKRWTYIAKVWESKPEVLYGVFYKTFMHIAVQVDI